MSIKNLREIWKSGNTVINGWLTIPGSWTAELAAQSGFNALTIDMQHGLADYSTAVSMIRTISSLNIVPMVRVPWNEPVSIMRLLYAGACGIIAPMINNSADAQSLVQYCRYPPSGHRSYGPIKAGLADEENYFADANHNILVIAMIEKKEALNELDGILKTSGIDGVYIGTVDLSISLGLEKHGDLEHPVLKEAIDQILLKTEKLNLIAGIHASSPDQAIKLRRMGFNLITPYNDSKVLLKTAKKMVSSIKDA